MRSTEVVRINSRQNFRFALSAADYAAVSTCTARLEQPDGTIKTQTPTLSSTYSSVAITVPAADNNATGDYTLSCYVNGIGLNEVIVYTVKGEFEN